MNCWHCIQQFAPSHRPFTTFWAMLLAGYMNLHHPSSDRSTGVTSSLKTQNQCLANHWKNIERLRTSTQFLRFLVARCWRSWTWSSQKCWFYGSGVRCDFRWNRRARATHQGHVDSYVFVAEGLHVFGRPGPQFMVCQQRLRQHIFSSRRAILGPRMILLTVPVAWLRIMVIYYYR